jgi:O-antigen/teichoic acid export membrane protein
MDPDGLRERAELSSRSADGPSDPSMSGQIASGLAWKTLSQVLAYGTQVIVLITMAHLLTPRDFGLAGMVMVFSALVSRVPDLGLGAALVQRPVLDSGDRSTAFWTSTAVGGFLTAVCLVTAPAVAGFYGEPRVRPLFMAFGFAFVLEGIATTQGALLMREMAFRSLEIRIMAATVCGAAVGIGVALAGGGPWAIVLQSLASTAVGVILLWRFSSWRPRASFSRVSLRNLGKFGGNVFGARLLLLGRGNVDNVLVGRFLGPAALGAYALAYNIMLIPLNRLGTPVQEVFYPAFAKLRNLDRIASAWFRANRLVAAVAAPALLGLMVLAPDFIHVVLGARWRRAVPVLQILTYIGLLQALQLLNISVLQAANKTGVLLRYWVLVSIASVTAFVIGLHWGIVGVAAAYAVSSTVMEPYYAFVTVAAVGGSLSAFVRNIARVVAAAGAMALVVLGVRALLIGAGLGPAPRLFVCAVIGVAVYVPLFMRLEPLLGHEIRGALGQSARRLARKVPVTR